METTFAPQTMSMQPKIEQRLHEVVDQGPVEIEKRLDHLTNKWTVGRISKVLLGLVITLGLVLGQFVSPNWLILSFVGAACLLQYAFSPTSPLERLLKLFGMRTGSDITQEKVALKTLRGDFHEVPTIHKIEDRDAISRMEGEGGIPLNEDSKVDVKVAIPQVIEASNLPIKNVS